MTVTLANKCLFVLGAKRLRWQWLTKRIAIHHLLKKKKTQTKFPLTITSCTFVAKIATTTKLTWEYFV